MPMPMLRRVSLMFLAITPIIAGCKDDRRYAQKTDCLQQAQHLQPMLVGDVTILMPMYTCRKYSEPYCFDKQQNQKADSSFCINQP